MNTSSKQAFQPVPMTQSTEGDQRPAFHDWVGLAAWQEDIAFGKTLEDLAGLDHTRWVIVGFTIIGSKESATMQVRADIVDKHELGLIEGGDVLNALAEHAQRFGSVPVHRRILDGVSLGALLAQLKFGHVTMRANRLRDTKFEIASANPSFGER